MSAAQPIAIRGTKLGTFSGVFTPSVLTILGVILFLRLGFVVGSGGLMRALLIIGAATSISVLTSLSLAAIATNIRVKGGGDYYLISRTLGIHYGGAIGLVLFLAQSVSVAFYCIGFGEAVAVMVGSEGDAGTVAGIAGVAALALGVIAFFGADFATKFQFVIMGALGLALVSFFVGGIGMAERATLSESIQPPSDTDGHSFWVLFAIFFPAVTGFTQGVSMSGDLRDPAKSLPRGTFWAIGVSTMVYVGAAVVLAASLPLANLESDYGSMRRIAAVPWLIDAGVIAATLSSAMASFLGAPRILQSLARDNVIPPLRMFAKGSGPENNPRRGVILAGAVAMTTIALGSLNVIASLVGMCFLLSYGLLNYATFIEAKANSPSFRPSFKHYHAWLSLVGAVLCVGVGVMISPVAAAIAGAIMVALHQYLQRTAPKSAWADSRYAYHFRRVRDHLMDMRGGSKHSRDWRPHVLALCNDPVDRKRLLTFASWIDGDSGITTAVRILTPENGDGPDRISAAEETLRGQIAEAGMETFARVISAPTTLEGLTILIQAHGLGSLKANTILMSANEHFGGGIRNGDEPPADALTAAFSQRRNLLLLEASREAWERTLKLPEEERRIDVWWRDDATSRFCLLLAHLVTRSEGWEDAKLRVHVMGDGPVDCVAQLKIAEEMLEEVRIDAEADAVDYEGPETLVDASKGASLVFLPLRLRGRRIVGPKGKPLAATLDLLPVTALAVAGEDIQLDADTDGEEAEATEETAEAKPESVEPPAELLTQDE